MNRNIVALGGWPADDRRLLDDFVLGLSGSDRPRVCFLPTASADSAESVVCFYAAMAGRNVAASHLPLFGTPTDPCAHLAGQDAVYVAGGNTANMLAVWRVHGVGAALREAWERGCVLAGASAGAICWFEDGVTDSFGPQLAPLRDGLGFLPGSFCPHYDGEERRRPVYQGLVRDGFPPGWAADDGVALHFAGTELREIVSSLPAARAYRVQPDGEIPVEPRLLP